MGRVSCVVARVGAICSGARFTGSDIWFQGEGIKLLGWCKTVRKGYWLKSRLKMDFATHHLEICAILLLMHESNISGTGLGLNAKTERADKVCGLHLLECGR
jgi:hypothetical protein